jgi:hypothetical protein
MTDLAEVRRDLAKSQHELLLAKDKQRRLRLNIELDMLASVDGDAKKIGSNEEDRKRRFDAACDADTNYRVQTAAVRDLQLLVAKLEAELNIYLDDRFERDLEVRKRNVDIVVHQAMVAFREPVA